MNNDFLNQAATLDDTIRAEQDTLREKVLTFDGSPSKDLPGSITFGRLPLYAAYRAILQQTLFADEPDGDRADRVLRTMAFARFLAAPDASRMSKLYIQYDLAEESGIDEGDMKAGQARLLDITPEITAALKERPDSPDIGYVVELRECLFDCHDATVGILVDGDGAPVAVGYFTPDDTHADIIDYFAADKADYGMTDVVPARYLRATTVTEAARAFRERRPEFRKHQTAVQSTADFFDSHSLEMWTAPKNLSDIADMLEIDAKLALAPSAACLVSHYLALMIARRMMIDLAGLLPDMSPDTISAPLTEPMLIRKADDVLQLYDMNDATAALLRALRLPLLHTYLSESHLAEVKALIDPAAADPTETRGEDFA